MFMNQKILVVDDHQLFSEGLKMTLSSRGFQLFSRDSVSSALAFLSRDSVDLILLDLNLPGEGGLSLLKQLNDKEQLLPVLILSASQERSDIDQAITLGARGYIGKSANGDQLEAAIVTVLKGEVFLPDNFTSMPSNEGRAKAIGITPRQLDVLKLLAKGLPNKSICNELSLTSETVKSHLKAIYGRLNVHNRTACVLAATELGLV
jgi:DNA-binding NarL/FixJ family response regulator